MKNLLKIISAVFLFPLFLSCEMAMPVLQGQVQVQYLRSQAMHRLVPATVVLPAKYFQDEKKTRRYPVIYLLHGYSGSHRQWLNIADLPALADRYETIFVCPDGGYDSWYVDSPVADSVRYESYIMHELMTHIDTTYRTRGAAGRAVTGLSMGGHGALRFLALYPDSFAAGGSMSGILDLRPFPGSWNIAGRLGDLREHPQRWAENSAAVLVRNLKGKNKGIIVSCGTEDFALAVNRAFRDSAAVYKIPVEYQEDAGAHSRDYWAAHLEPHVQFFQQYFKH